MTRMVDPGFLIFLRQQPCCLCGRLDVEAAHIRIGLFAMGRKPDDKLATPLCRTHHREQHSMSERQFWQARGLNPFMIARRLYALYGGTGGVPYRKPKRRRMPAGRGHTGMKANGLATKCKIPSRPFPKQQRKLRA